MRVGKLLITGADGFVGRWLVRAALREGWAVVAAVSPEGADPSAWLDSDQGRVETRRGDLLDPAYREQLSTVTVQAVIHLAAVASGAAARRDPVSAWTVNAGVTAALCEAMAASAPRFLLVSTGEVYGAGHDAPIPESAPLRPISPYAASKLGAEIAAGEVARRTGMPLLIARPFPHTGPGQADHYVYPALVARLRAARESGKESISVGNLSPVRDLLDVRDVVSAYLRILESGSSGDIFNVASGAGESLADSLTRLMEMMQCRVRAEVDSALVRQADLPVLIGDATLLREITGWRPLRLREQIFRELIDAQKD